MLPLCFAAPLKHLLYLGGRMIRKGEELFSDYNYDMTHDSAPGWYKKLYRDWYRIGTGSGSEDRH